MPLLLFFNILICVLCPLISFYRFRSVLHPHFMFTVAWTFLLPLGMVVSSQPPDYLSATTKAALPHYELLINGFLLTLFVVTLFLPSSNSCRAQLRAIKDLNLPEAKARWLAYVGLVMVGLEFLNELATCHGSVTSWVSYSLGPRYDRPWSGSYVGTSTFIYVFTFEVFEASAFLLPIVIFRVRGMLRMAVGLAYALTLWILVCNGSRSPVAVMLLTTALVLYMHARSLLHKAAIVSTFGFVVAAITAVMAFYRTGGVPDTLAQSSVLDKIHYQQDDNYYRLIKIMSVAQTGEAPTWNAPVFIEASLLNPVPRYFWPGKPLLTPEFYGDWKVYYVTVTFIGECVAMFGTWWGLCAAAVVGLGYYELTAAAARRLNHDYGLLLYLGVCYYIYLSARSIQNLGMAAVMILSIVAIYMYLSRKKVVYQVRRRRRGKISGEQPREEVPSVPARLPARVPVEPVERI